jgi:hypothetical protein
VKWRNNEIYTWISSFCTDRAEKSIPVGTDGYEVFIFHSSSGYEKW